GRTQRTTTQEPWLQITRKPKTQTRRLNSISYKHKYSLAVENRQ
ncbi:MAG: hypothetical protein ACI9ZV_000999, partial [Candidatus Azotimanducaceae bacterium]